MFSEAHRLSLEAWQNGERAWPWPDATPDQQAAADQAVRGLADDFLNIAKGHRQFVRQQGSR